MQLLAAVGSYVPLAEGRPARSLAGSLALRPGFSIAPLLMRVQGIWCSKVSQELFLDAICLCLVSLLLQLVFYHGYITWNIFKRRVGVGSRFSQSSAAGSPHLQHQPMNGYDHYDFFSSFCLKKGSFVICTAMHIRQPT